MEREYKNVIYCFWHRLGEFKTFLWNKVSTVQMYCLYTFWSQVRPTSEAGQRLTNCLQ